MSNSRHGRPNGPVASSAAGYIAAVADELAELAKSHHFDALAYILDMARLEADQLAKSGPGDGKSG
jgi:hypothetical protein